MTFATTEGRAVRRAARKAAVTTMIDRRNAAIFAAEDATRAKAIADKLFDLGVPTDPVGAATWHERQAEQARLTAAKQDMARIAAVAAQLEHDEFQAQIDQQARDRARVDELKATLAALDKTVKDATDRQHALEVSRELAETGKQLAGRLEEQLLRIRGRVAMDLSITVGEHALLERFGVAH